MIRSAIKVPVSVLLAIGFLGGAVLTPAMAQSPASAETASSAEQQPLPSIEAAMALPTEQLLALASRTLLGQPRRLDYGFDLLLSRALQGDRVAVRLLAKAIDANVYGFGDRSPAVLRALANEAMLGSTSAVVAWALMHDRGIDMPQDLRKAYEWYRWAAIVGSQSGAQLTAMALAQGRGVAVDKQEALVWANRLPPLRRGAAYMQLAKIWHQGDTAIQDVELAEKLALESAKLDPAYRVPAAEFLSKHSNNPETLAEVQQLLEEAAAEGDLKAQFYLAEADTAEVANESTEDLYARLAAAGDDEAITIIAEGLTSAAATAEDKTETLELLRSGARSGSLVAMKALSNAYFFGFGTEVSFESAAQFYLQAADAGDPESQYQLGLMYANAIGLDRDIVQARYWLRKSAEGGYRLAEASLLTLPAN